MGPLINQNKYGKMGNLITKNVHAHNINNVFMIYFTDAIIGHEINTAGNRFNTMYHFCVADLHGKWFQNNGIDINEPSNAFAYVSVYEVIGLDFHQCPTYPLLRPLTVC